MTGTTCLNTDQLHIYHNPDGTISAYSILTGVEIPYHLTKPCCENIGGTFDVNSQKCFYGKVIDGCDYSLPFNLVLNPKGNDGAIFSEVVDESCSLEVKFDYLFKFDCDVLSSFINGTYDSTCTTLDSVFERLGASMSIDKIVVTPYGVTTTPVFSDEFFPPIGNGNLLSYLQDNSGNTGFYICQVNDSIQGCNELDLGDDVFVPRSNCATFAEQILLTHPTIPLNAFASDWLTYTTEITDESILSGITDEKIKLSIKISGFCIDMCVLVDNIKLNKKCSKKLKDDIFVTKSPGFELDRIIDNKKSWVTVTETTHREFSITKADGTQPIRYTDYYLESERQVLNTKEIDLDIDIASAVETDIWCYISDNPCILTGTTIGTTTCVKDAYQTTSGVSITITSETQQVVVYTACTVDVFSSITTSYPAVTAYTCPIGFSATPANDQCQSIITQAATSPTNLGPIISNGDKNGANYSVLGAYFYPEVTNISSGNPVLPYTYRSDGQLIDGQGNVVVPIAVNNSNSFWASLGSSSNGRLNNIGILAIRDTWAGFTQCIDIVSGGTYYLGIAADNQARFFVNGVLVANFNQNLVENFRKWSVFPVQFNSGVNIIEMQGLDAGVDSAFAAEVYYPIDFATLTGATSTGLTEANVLFSTTQRVGTRFDTGDGIGYSCPAGFVFSNCGTPSCVRIQKQPINVNVIEIPDTVSAFTITSATTCPILSAITISGTVTGITAPNTCSPKTYCCSEYCGDANIDIERLFTQPLSAVTTIEDFQYYTTSQLIDAKNRKTISTYATLRLLYDRYMNSLAFCNTKSAAFDYYSMEKFGNLIGNYWVDLIEQVIPATTIWGSTRIYTNTMFDEQKHKYKAYTSFFGTPVFLQVLSPATGATCDVEIVTSVISGDTNTLPQFNQQTYSMTYLTQMNSGSEFIGTVKVIGKNSSPCSDDDISACELTVEIQDNIPIDGTLLAVASNYTGNVTYVWVTPTEESSSSSVTATVNGLYTVTVTDGCCTATASISIKSF